MNEKIIEMPISYKERDYNLHGVGYVPCNVSSRWLQFSKTYDSSHGLVSVDVMTLEGSNKPKKICELVLNINDLKLELEKIIPK